jgi:hypothetical protein
MQPHNNVTREQIKKWWVLSRQLGHNRARRLTQKVTKGISSLTHPQMTRWKMTQVLNEMTIAADQISQPNPIPPGGKIIHLVTADQLAAIDVLKKTLTFSQENFEIMCQRVLKKNKPETHQDAIILMSRMAKAISESRNP